MLVKLHMVLNSKQRIGIFFTASTPFACLLVLCLGLGPKLGPFLVSKFGAQTLKVHSAPSRFVSSISGPFLAPFFGPKTAFAPKFQLLIHASVDVVLIIVSRNYHEICTQFHSLVYSHHYTTVGTATCFNMHLTVPATHLTFRLNPMQLRSALNSCYRYQCFVQSSLTPTTKTKTSAPNTFRHPHVTMENIKHKIIIA